MSREDKWRGRGLYDRSGGVGLSLSIPFWRYEEEKKRDCRGRVEGGPTSFGLQTSKKREKGPRREPGKINNSPLKIHKLCPQTRGERDRSYSRAGYRNAEESQRNDNRNDRNSLAGGIQCGRPGQHSCERENPITSLGRRHRPLGRWYCPLDRRYCPHSPCPYGPRRTGGRDRRHPCPRRWSNRLFPCLQTRHRGRVCKEELPVSYTAFQLDKNNASSLELTPHPPCPDS